MHRDDKCKLHALVSVRRYVRRCFQAVRQHSKKFRWVRTMSILKNTFALSYRYRIHAWQVLRYRAEYLFYREYFP